jgi:3-phosphoshikimate 1-carboxyvinyltransferase
VQRLVALAVLTKGETRIAAGSLCDDVRAALSVAAAMGARVSREPGSLVLHGKGRPDPARLDCGESGLSLRMFSAVAALAEGPSLLEARGSLCARPVAMLEEPLRALGARCSSRAGLPPVTVEGPLRGGEVALSGALTSQFLTGLLVATPRAESSSVLHVADLASTPYVDLTLSLVEQAGGRVVRDGYRRFEIAGGQEYRPRAWQAEGDWSGAAFPLVAGAVAGRVRVTGLSRESRQADVRVLQALSDAGATVLEDEQGVTCARARLRGFTFDATDCPDLLPPLVALAAHCEGESVLGGSARLRHKESDRVAALTAGFSALGVEVADDGAALRVRGGRVGGGRVASFGDHRIAMALAVAALAGQGAVTIEGAGAISKSYEGFFDDLVALGAVVEEVP